MNYRNVITRDEFLELVDLTTAQNVAERLATVTNFVESRYALFRSYIGDEINAESVLHHLHSVTNDFWNNSAIGLSRARFKTTVALALGFTQTHPEEFQEFLRKNHPHYDERLNEITMLLEVARKL